MININQKLVNMLGCMSLVKSQSIHSLSKQINEPYTSVHRHIILLSTLGVVILQQTGKAQLISLNLKNELTRHLLSIASYSKRQIFFKQYPVLKIVSMEFGFTAPLVVFGSYAKKTVRKGSDIDLCTIGLTSREEKTFKKSLRHIEMIHKVEINCLFFKKPEFTAMLASKAHNVGKEIILNHAVLRNADLWHNFIAEVYDELRL